MKDAQKNKSNSKKNTNIILGVAAVIVIGIAAFTFLNPKNKDEPLAEQPKPTAISVTDENGNMVIPKDNISETATFYVYDELDTYMEILSVKASDGTIRTAFNTCQVCYASGRGYYVQEGDFLKCQNCGNRFGMDDIEIAKGGCNPVPIFNDWKTETETMITIPKDLFVEAESIFANWKN